MDSLQYDRVEGKSASSIILVSGTVHVSVLVVKLTSRMLIRAKNKATCLAGDKDQIICVIFYENAPS